ncbi:MAG: porin [Balneolaceae bacterium]
MIKIKSLIKAGMLLSMIAAGAIQTASAQNQEPLTDQMRDFLKSDPFNVSFLLQSTANITLQDDNFNGGNGFGLGATRLKFSGNVDGGFNYNLQTDFRRTPSVFDAAIGYRASEGFGIKAGMQKPDIGLDLQPNPGATDFIDRARLIGEILNSREVGVSASGQFEQFDYTVSVFNGNGRNLSNNDNFMFAAKGAFSVDLENDGSLYIGANGAINGTEGEQPGSFNLTSEGDRLIYGVFADYESDNWFGAAELLMTTFESNQVPDDETITGAYVTIGNNVTEKDQILARWDHIGYNEVDYKSNLFVFGWNHQATSVISLQVNALGQFDDGEEFFGLAGNFQYQF